MAQVKWYNPDTNTRYEYTAPNAPALPPTAPKIVYEPIAAAHGTEWSMMLGVIVALVTLLVTAAGLAVQHFGFVTLLVTGPFVVGGVVAVAVGVLNHQQHLAYHRAVIGQIQPQEPTFDAGAWTPPPPPPRIGPMPEQLREDKLCTLIERAYKRGDCTKIRTGDNVTSAVYRVRITKEDGEDLYDELRMRGILQQNASGVWECVPGMTHDAACAIIDASYP